MRKTHYFPAVSRTLSTPHIIGELALCYNSTFTYMSVYAIISRYYFRTRLCTCIHHSQQWCWGRVPLLCIKYPSTHQLHGGWVRWNRWACDARISMCLALRIDRLRNRSQLTLMSLYTTWKTACLHYHQTRMRPERDWTDFSKLAIKEKWLVTQHALIILPSESTIFQLHSSRLIYLRL